MLVSWLDPEDTLDKSTVLFALSDMVSTKLDPSKDALSKKVLVSWLDPEDTVDHDRVPDPLVDRTCPFVPSELGKVQVTFEEIEVGATKAT